jgi:hypothetical protein
VLGMALGIGLTCLTLVVHFLRRGPREAAREGRSLSLVRERRAVGAIFGLPHRWLAIRSGNLHSVQSALALHNPTPCSWEEGLSAAHEQKLFISPPIAGWILVFGSNLPDPSDDIDRCHRFVTGLSRKLGQVQFFSVNRALNHHAWVHVEGGRVVRAYAWAGTTLWNQGAATQTERELGLRCLDYAVAAERVDFERADPMTVNTERVPLLASRWSIDPSSIDARMLKTNQGVAGRLSRSPAR